MSFCDSLLHYLQIACNPFTALSFFYYILTFVHFQSIYLHIPYFHFSSKWLTVNLLTPSILLDFPQVTFTFQFQNQLCWGCFWSNPSFLIKRWVSSMQTTTLFVNTDWPPLNQSAGIYNQKYPSHNVTKLFILRKENTDDFFFKWISHFVIFECPGPVVNIFW